MSAIVISISTEDLGEILFGDGITVKTNVQKYDNLQEIVIKLDKSKDKSTVKNCTDCELCQKQYDMPYGVCCPDKCGEYYFCKRCTNGIYFKKENKKIR